MLESFDSFWAVYSNLVLTLGTNSLLALSIYLTLSCGMLAMANAAFMGIGAYAASLLTMNAGVPFPVALAGGMAAPAVVGLMMGGPTLGLSGVYLAMATLAFGEVVRIVVLNTEGWTGGALGLNGIPPLTQWWHVALSLAAAAGLILCGLSQPASAAATSSAADLMALIIAFSPLLRVGLRWASRPMALMNAGGVSTISRASRPL